MRYIDTRGFTILSIFNNIKYITTHRLSFADGIALNYQAKFASMNNTKAIRGSSESSSPKAKLVVNAAKP